MLWRAPPGGNFWCDACQHLQESYLTRQYVHVGIDVTQKRPLRYGLLTGTKRPLRACRICVGLYRYSKGKGPLQATLTNGLGYSPLCQPWRENYFRRVTSGCVQSSRRSSKLQNKTRLTFRIEVGTKGDSDHGRLSGLVALLPSQWTNWSHLMALFQHRPGVFFSNQCAISFGWCSKSKEKHSWTNRFMLEELGRIWATRRCCLFTFALACHQ